MAGRIHALATLRDQEGMNATERKYDGILELRLRAGEILRKEFGCVKLRLGEKCWYTADFLVISKDTKVELHEVKTYWKNAQRAGWQEDARVKIKVCADFYPFKFIAATLMPDGSWEFEEF